MSDLTPANENPWYVLMTLYGEQEGDDIDWDLAKKYRAAWHAWTFRARATDDIRDDAKSVGVDISELSQSLENRNAIQKLAHEQIAERCGAGTDIPNRGSDIDLSNTRFERILDLAGFVFQNIAFTSSQFYRHVNLSRCLFLGYAIFDESEFSQDLLFYKGKFRFGFRMSGVEAHGNIRIRSVQLAGDFNVDNCDFRENVRIQNIDCTGGFYAHSARFRQGANFDGLLVERSTIWDDASFEGKFQCLRGRMTSNVVFNGCRFFMPAIFDGTKFEGEQSFQKVIFGQGVSFESVTFHGSSFFNNAVFGANPPDLFGSLDFRNTRWKAPVNFEGAKFNGWYPRLRGATFEEEATFTAENENWDVSNSDLEVIPEYVVKEARETLAKLRHRMTSQGLPEEEHFFFRREMGFAAQIDPWGAGLPYRVFGALSDFGQSILRPAIGLLTLWVVGALIYTISYAWGAFDNGQPPSKILFGFGLSFANIFKFLGLQRSYFDVTFTQSLHPWLQVMGGFQTVAGFILLFFLGLGLRTRFRLR